MKEVIITPIGKIVQDKDLSKITVGEVWLDGGLGLNNDSSFIDNDKRLNNKFKFTVVSDVETNDIYCLTNQLTPDDLSNLTQTKVSNTRWSVIFPIGKETNIEELISEFKTYPGEVSGYFINRPKETPLKYIFNKEAGSKNIKLSIIEGYLEWKFSNKPEDGCYEKRII